jgi:xanthine dehydrogenase accessory factor
MSAKLTASTLDELPQLLHGEPAVAMATLVAATGSTSKKVGAKMWVGASGRILGGVTIGGCVDARVIEAADEVVKHGARALIDISLDDDEAWEIGLTCGGSVEVLVEPISPDGDADPILGAYGDVCEAMSDDGAAVVATTLDGDGGRLVVNRAGEVVSGTLGDASLDAAAAGIAQRVAAAGGSRTETIATPAGNRRVYFERHAPPMTLVIVGAGPIAMALSRFARELDMRSIIVDGRPRYATPERFPDADEIHVGMPSEIVSAINPGRTVAVILVSHDYKYELPVLRSTLRSPVAYLGMLGSRKRGKAVRELLTDEGFTADELARLHTPIGLDIGAATAGEIALSILGEIVGVRSGKLSTA